MPGIYRIVSSLIVPLLVSCLANGQPAPSERPFVPSSRWALVIGASRYSADIGPLRYTSKEAREFAEELTGKLGFELANIRLLADGGSTDQAPTSEHILGALDSLLSDKRLDKGNLFVFYFSGHGVGLPKSDYLLPSDVDKDRIEQMGVPVEKVIGRIVDAGLKNVLFIADACRAGTQNEFGAHLIELCRKANIAVILGCAPGKRSYEYAPLRQGAFTHFLIQELNDSALRDGSGSLWASRVGSEVQKRVHDFTEPDHGKFAQVPSIWAEQSTLDVLLGVYPQPPITDQAVQQFEKSAEKLDRKQFAAAMMDYAAQLALNDRHDQCVDLLKAVDQLGELTPAGRYILATSLGFLGRTGEAERTFGDFTGFPDGYYKDLALATSSSRQVDPKRRVQAAMRLFQTDPVWVDKMLAWTAVRASGTYEQQLHLARLFARLDAPTKRQRLYAQGCLADLEGRWRDAADAFERATKSPGKLPGDDVLFMCRLSPTLGLNDPKALDGWIEEGIHHDPTAVVGWLEKAWVAKNSGDVKGRVEALRQALARNPDPEQIWRAAKLAGAFIGRLQSEFETAASRQPYAWRSRLVRAFVHSIQGDQKKVKEDETAQELYREDPLTYDSKIFELMESLMSEGVMLGRIKELDYRDQVEFYFLGLLSSVDKFGYDPDLWMQITQYGLLNERNLQLGRVVVKKLPFAPESVPKELRPMLLFLAINCGDEALAHRLLAATFDPQEGDDPAWLYAAFQATRGQEVEAGKRIAKLRRPSENLLPRMEALKTYLLAKSGKTAQARVRLRSSVNDLVVRGFEGLAWAAMGDWKMAEPLLAEQARSRNWAFLFVSEFAMRVLDARYRKTGRLDDARMLALSAAAAQPGNPLFHKYSYAAQPGLAQFAGSVMMGCVAIDDRITFKSMAAGGKKDYVFGDLSYSVSPQGDLVGSFTEKNGQKHPFAGRIDALGNLTGHANWMGRSLIVVGKLAPPPLYKSFAGLKELGQMLQLIDEQGYRIALVGRP